MSLFAGAGGLDLAFASTGTFRSVGRVEVDPTFAESLRLAETSGLLDPAPIHVQDVGRLSPHDAWPKAAGGIRGVIGGPPCESFSSMGRRAGTSDPRGSLVFTFARWVIESEADFFLMENVPALASASDGAVLGELVATLEHAGFQVEYRVVNAADFGAATLRKRLFLLGTRRLRVDFPEPTHYGDTGDGTNRRPWVTVGDVLCGLPAPTSQAPSEPSGHVLVHHTDSVRDRFSKLRQGSYDNVRKRSRLSWDRPSPSLVAGNASGTRSHIHPLEPRELTNRESARIQGFPDAFQFAGASAGIRKQIANAVPIALGQAFARSFADSLLK